MIKDGNGNGLIEHVKGERKLEERDEKEKRKTPCEQPAKPRGLLTTGTHSKKWTRWGVKEEPGIPPE